LIDTLKYLTSITPARSFKNLKSLNSIADYIKKDLKKMGSYVHANSIKENIVGMYYY